MSATPGVYVSTWRDGVLQVPRAWTFDFRHGLPVRHNQGRLVEAPGGSALSGQHETYGNDNHRWAMRWRHRDDRGDGEPLTLSPSGTLSVRWRAAATAEAQILLQCHDPLAGEFFSNLLITTTPAIGEGWSTVHFALSHPDTPLRVATGDAFDRVLLVRAITIMAYRAADSELQVQELSFTP